jgi:hypothetical protein
VAALPFSKLADKPVSGLADCSSGRPAGRLSIWWTLENRFKKDFFRTENPLPNTHTQEEKILEKKAGVSDRICSCFKFLCFLHLASTIGII